MNQLDYRTNTSGNIPISPLQQVARGLSYAGIIPFLSCFSLIWLNDRPYDASQLSYTFIAWTLYYGAIILSFLGGIRWGAVLATPRLPHDQGINSLLGAILAALIAWAAVTPSSLMPNLIESYSARYMMLILAFLIYAISDTVSSHDNGLFPSWYGQLRLIISAYVTILLIFITIRLKIWGF